MIKKKKLSLDKKPVKEVQVEIFEDPLKGFEDLIESVVICNSEIFKHKEVYRLKQEEIARQKLAKDNRIKEYVDFLKNIESILQKLDNFSCYEVPIYTYKSSFHHYEVTFKLHNYNASIERIAADMEEEKADKDEIKKNLIKYLNNKYCKSHKFRT